MTRLQCDLNVNEQLGLNNSAFIRHYCNLLPNLRPLVQTIKLWAKPLSLNDSGTRSKQTSFSSYALTMMTIGLLQVLHIIFHNTMSNTICRVAVCYLICKKGSMTIQVLTISFGYALESGGKDPHLFQWI